MKATETQLLTFLEGKKQFVIPIYQRTYSWTQKQCRQLWNDVLVAGRERSVSGHFVGSIVYIQEGLYQGSGIPQLLIIDGQQRLTTLSLLLTAISQAAENTGNPEDEDLAFSGEEIREGYLLNKYGKQDQRYKLLLTQSDRDTLKSLVDESEPPENTSSRVLQNFRFFQEQIHKSDISLNEIYQGVAKLLIVDISLDRNYDDPQLIFESLNSTGLDLSQADLIRNYILMGLEPDLQERIYNNHWFRMEQSFRHDGNSSYFDRFMRDYLTLKSKSGNIPKTNEVYDAFKNYTHSTPMSIEETVEDVYRHSKHFVKLAFLREEDREIRQILGAINRLKVEVAYPLLLKVYDDYSEGKVPREDFIAILELIEGYVFRRLICGIPTNSLNKTFASFGREIDEDSYLESVQAAFLLKDSYRRFPKDEEF